MGNRRTDIDILKGLGILMMVAGHAGAPLKSFISLFHMAIFFIALTLEIEMDKIYVYERIFR